MLKIETTCLKNILEILDVYKYVLFDNQDPELFLFSFLMGFIKGTRFEKKYRLQNGKKVMLTVVFTLYTNKGYFVVDCRNK